MLTKSTCLPLAVRVQFACLIAAPVSSNMCRTGPRSGISGDKAVFYAGTLQNSPGTVARGLPE